MAIEGLTAKEKHIVLQCMKATAAYIDDREKHARVGMKAGELQQLIARWPNLDDGDERSNDFLAINNCMNEVCNGFQIPPGQWNRWFDATIDEVESTYRKWLALRNTPGGIR